MPNPYHFRAAMDRLWRRANGPVPAYKQLDALDALVREMFAPNERARRNHRLYLATDPFDVARHLLRDLYDRADPSSSPPAGSGGRCLVETEGGSLQGQEPSDEDDDPL